MKNVIVSFAVVAFVGFVGLRTSAHGGDEQRITIEQEGTGHYEAGQIDFTFQLFDTETNKTLSEQDLNESHTKKLHFIAYDAALKEFNHVHPIYDGKLWTASLSLPKNGKYFLWAQGELLDKTEFSSSLNAMVMNGETENPILPLGDVRTGTDLNTKIVLAAGKIKAGKMAMLNFIITRTDGLDPVLSPYLGAFAHVISTPTDGDELTHVHPEAGNKPNTGMLHATFPTAGDYRLWIQLMDRGELKTIPLSVTVSK